MEINVENVIIKHLLLHIIDLFVVVSVLVLV